jgi:hypothetical protein
MHQQNQSPSIPADAGRPGDPALTNAELVQLRIRVVALENLVITLLADAAQRQRDQAREMAHYISPRPGCTPHPVTIHAAAQMIHLVERAAHFGAVTPPS